MARAPVPTVDEFRALSVRPEAFPESMNASIAATLSAWTDKAASFTGKHTRRVIVAWDGSFTLAIVDCAGFDLMTHRGFKKDQGADSAIQVRRDKAMEWLGQVARGEVEPFVDDGANYDDDGPRGGRSERSDDWTRYETNCGCT
jgi:hypothetical protein